MNKINKAFCSRIIAALLCGFLAATTSFAGGDPVSELNSIADQLISKLKENKTTLKDNPSLVYSIANEVVVPHADVDVMAKRVLPPKVWASASASQRSRFESAFTTLLVHTYASALANYNDQTIRFYPVRGGYAGKNSVQVNSAIERPDGPAISVNYKMVRVGSEWKVYDLSVEGVSMLESFRSQFADQLAQGDIEALINKLSSHNTTSSSD
jgi:phospholipid transport system substrate-binding protein